MRSFRRCPASVLPAAALLAATLFPSTAVRAQAPMAGLGPVADQEKAMWESFKSGDYAAARARMSPDFLTISAAGFSSPDESITMMKQCKIASYSLGAAQTRALGKDAVMVSYPASMELDCGPAGSATHVSSNINVASTWVKRDGKWVIVAHVGIQAPPAQPGM